MDHNDKNTCCPEVDTKKWEHQTHVWDNKMFIKDSIRLFLHMPSPKKVNKIITGLWQKAQDQKAAPEEKDFLLLAHDLSPWKGEYLLAVEKEVSDAVNTTLSGTFISKVFDGPYNAIPKFIKKMDAYLKEENKSAKQYYFYYTTCPECAKKYGHNYIIAFAKV